MLSGENGFGAYLGFMESPWEQLNLHLIVAARLPTYSLHKTRYFHDLEKRPREVRGKLRHWLYTGYVIGK